MTAKTQKKHLVCLVPIAEMEAVEQRCRIEKVTKTAFVRRALSMYDQLLEAKSKGRAMFMRTDDGEITDVMPL